MVDAADATLQKAPRDLDGIGLGIAFHVDRRLAEETGR